MNRKMVRGVIVLIALVGIAGFFLLIGRNTDTEPKKVYKVPSEEVLEKVRSDLAAKPTPNGHQQGEHETAQVLKRPEYMKNWGNPSLVGKEEFVIIPPLPPSAVPEDIPEHLKLPSEWIDGYYHGFEDESQPIPLSPEEKQRAESIFQDLRIIIKLCYTISL